MKNLKIVGHRGAKGLAPENTIASIKKALEYGVDEVEIDARVTKDGVAVLAHDECIHDDSGNKIEVATHSLEELRAHKPDLATLADAIKAVNKAKPTVVEVKSKVPVEPIVAVLNEFLNSGWQAENFLLASFDFKILKELHKQLPEISKIVNEHLFGTRASYRARSLKAKRLCINQEVLWFGFIASVRHNYQLYAYTLNDPIKARRWVKWGLAGVVTDFPDRFH